MEMQDTINALQREIEALTQQQQQITQVDQQVLGIDIINSFALGWCGSYRWNIISDHILWIKMPQNTFDDKSTNNITWAMLTQGWRLLSKILVKCHVS